MTQQLKKEDLDLHTLLFSWFLCPIFYSSSMIELVLPIIKYAMAPLEVALNLPSIRTHLTRFRCLNKILSLVLGIALFLRSNTV
jgi:hypothetical protein